jgi:hypothetical protein
MLGIKRSQTGCRQVRTSHQPKPKLYRNGRKDRKEKQEMQSSIFLCARRALCGKRVWLIAES